MDFAELAFEAAKLTRLVREAEEEALHISLVDKPYVRAYLGEVRRCLEQAKGLLDELRETRER